MFKLIAACVALVFMASGLAHARPFTAKDLATLERVSDPHVSPDGRFVAFNLRSTDWDDNRAFNALWVIDRSATNSARRLVRDLEKSSTSPRWSPDGQWLYFLSSRSGSVQVWRTPANGGESGQVTKLPLDVGLYRLAPDGRTLVAAINVHAECDTLACSKAKDDAKAKEKNSGTLYDTVTPRFWDTYLDGRYIIAAANGAPPVRDSRRSASYDAPSLELAGLSGHGLVERLRGGTRRVDRGPLGRLEFRQRLPTIWNVTRCHTSGSVVDISAPNFFS